MQAIVEAVNKLTTQLEETQAELSSLQAQADLSEKRLHNAAVLTASLSDEAVRWSQIAEARKQDLDFVVGNVLLASASVCYLGPFSAPFRAMLVAAWIAGAQAAGLPVDPAFSVRKVLSSDMEARTWWLQVCFSPRAALPFSLRTHHYAPGHSLASLPP